MTTPQVQQLIAVCPVPPAGSRLDLTKVFGLARNALDGGADDLLNQPDAGWRIANRLAPTTAGKPAAVPDEPEFRWVAAAVATLRGKADPDAGPVRAAVGLSKDPDLRPVLEAALVAPDATVAQVADALGLDPDVIGCFSDLFFNVPDRRGDLRFVRAVVHRRRDDEDPDLPSLRAVAFKTDLGTLLAAAGYQAANHDGRTARDQAREVFAQTMAEARIQLAAGGLRQRRPAPALTHALRILGGVQMHDLEDNRGAGAGSFLSQAIAETL